MKTILLLVSSLFLINVNAQNSVKNASVVANCSSCSGTYSWNFPAAMTHTIMMGGPGFAKDLQATNYGFNIPLTASITGIGVQFFHSSNFSHPTALVDTVVSLLKGGVVAGTDKRNLTGPYNSATAANVNLGGMGDMWGTTWTPTEINASNFGFNFKIYLHNVGNVDLNIMQGFVITVYYTSSTGINESQTQTGTISSVLFKENEIVFSDFEKLENPIVQIYDLTGKSILKLNPLEIKKMDLSFLNQGVYFYQITSSQENRSKKFIITK